MHATTLSSPDEAVPQRLCFLGLYPELCFVPTWLSRTERGYATLTAKELGRSEPAHRLVAMSLIGQLNEGDMVLHRCGNASCHNPFHLYVGGDAENHRDKLLHQQAGNGVGPLGLAYSVAGHQLLMPQPLALSSEPSRLPASFAGFEPGSCFHADWLHETFDGYRQLLPTSMSGELIGVHRKHYALFNGPLGRYDIVSHACGDKTCLNPFHLLISGRQESPRDFDAKHDKRFKLSSDGLAAIANLERSPAELAKTLGVHPQTVAALRADLRRGRSGDGGVAR